MSEGSRYDFEIAMSGVVVDYLVDRLDATVTDKCPVVSFIDPMSIDEADRIIVLPPSGETIPESTGNFAGQVDVAVKTRWTQPTLADCMARHFNRLRAVRDKLFAPDIIAALDALGDGIGIDFVQPRKAFTTKVTTDNWIYSETNLTVNAFFRAPNP